MTTGQRLHLLVAMDFPKNTHLHRRTRLRLDDFLPYLINRVGVALVARFHEQALAGHQLTIDMWRVLAALSDNGRQRQVDLIGMTSIEASTMSRLVTRLVRRGLVSRSRSRMNGREVVVELTGRGKALVEKLIPVALSVENSAIGAMGARDLARIKQILHRMYANLTRRRAEGSNGGARWSDTRTLVGEAENCTRRAGHHHGGTA